MTNEGAALLEIGAGCNADCVFCRRNETRRVLGAMPGVVDERPLESFLRLARRLGLKRLILGGDEPTVLGPTVLRRMLRLSARAGFRDIALYSNGIELGREPFRRHLLDGGVNAFFLPLYGPDAALHDAITQRKGSFDALARAVAGLVELRGRVKTSLHAVVLRQNEGRLDEMRALAAAWKVPLELHALRRRADPVKYGDLLPVAFGRPARPSRAGRGAPAAETAKPVELRYSVLLGRINYGEEPAPEVLDFLRGRLRGASLPRSAVDGALRGFEAKPALRDPERLLRLMERECDAFDVELLFPANAVAALALGLRTLKAGRRERAARALRDVLLFDSGDRRSLWAKEQARGVLEKMRGVPAGRGESCRG